MTYDLLLTVRWLDRAGIGTQLDLPAVVSFALVIDGRTVRLRPKGDVTREKDQSTHAVVESWSYPVSADIIRELAHAREVDVKVSGEGNALEGYFNKYNIAAFKRFWEECGDQTVQPSTPKH